MFFYSNLMKSFEKLLNIKNQLIWILFFSYIYDPVRLGYIERKRKNLQSIEDKFKTRAKQYQYNLRPLSLLSSSTKTSLSSTCNKISSKLCTKTSCAKSKSLLFLLKKRNSRVISKDICKRFCKQTIIEFISKNKLNQRKFIEQQTNFHTNENENANVNYECPLGEMPLIFRYYSYFSHTFITYMIIKYVILKLIRMEVFGLKKQFSCRIPGRITILPEYSPDFAMLVTSFHVIYRLYLCARRGRLFNLDCFIYLLYDEEVIMKKQERLLELQRELTSDRKQLKKINNLYKEFQLNHFFYHQINLGENEFLIKFKINRTLEQRTKLKCFVNRIVRIFIIGFITWSIPFLLLGIYSGLSENHWQFSYGHCNGFYTFITDYSNDNDVDNFNKSSILIDENNETFSTKLFSSSSTLFSMEFNSKSLNQTSGNVIFHWNTQRYLIFLYDFIETIWLLFDSSNGLIWPFSTLCICAQDMTLNMETLCDCVGKLVNKLQYSTMITTSTFNYNQSILETIDLQDRLIDENDCEQREEEEGEILIEKLKFRPEQESYFIWRQQKSQKFLQLLEEELLILQNNLIEIFKQLIETDAFVSKLSAFCIFTWLSANMYYQFLSLVAHGLLVPNKFIQYMQFLALFALTLSFGLLSRTHTKTIKLYKLISNLVALDPNFKSTKSNWPWVLEYYYHKDSSRYSFHLGPSAKLSLSNYIKSITWLLTCAFVTLNLLGYKLEILF